MKNTKETVKALEAVIETAQAQIKRLTQPQEKKVIGKMDIMKMLLTEKSLWGASRLDHQEIVNLGLFFTTEEKRDAHTRFRQAVANLMYACKPFLTEIYQSAFAPCLDQNNDPTWASIVTIAPKFLWVNSKEKALEIAEAHKEDLKVYLNYKWEL